MVASFLHGFALRPGGPHHRNAAASGANKNESLPKKAGAPPKAAYAVIGVFLFKIRLLVCKMVIKMIHLNDTILGTITACELSVSDTSH